MSGYLSKRMKMMRGITSSVSAKEVSDDDDFFGQKHKNASQKIKPSNKLLAYNGDDSVDSSSDEDSQHKPATSNKLLNNATSTGGGRAMDLLNDLSDDDDDAHTATRTNHKKVPDKLMDGKNKRGKGRKLSVSTTSSNSSVIAVSRPKSKTARRRAVIAEEEDEEIPTSTSCESPLKVDKKLAGMPDSLHDMLNSSQQSDVAEEDGNFNMLLNISSVDGISDLNISDILGPMGNSSQEKLPESLAGSQASENTTLPDPSSHRSLRSRTKAKTSTQPATASNGDIEMLAIRKSPSKAVSSQNSTFSHNESFAVDEAVISTAEKQSKYGCSTYFYATIECRNGVKKEVDLSFDKPPTQVLAREVASELSNKLCLNQQNDDATGEKLLEEVIVHALRDELWHEMLPSTPFTSSTNFIRCTVRSKAAGSCNSQQAATSGSKEAAKLNFFVQDGATREKFEVKIGRTDPMLMLKKQYCEAKSLGDCALVRFELDGERINDDDTAESLDLDGGECIDVVPPRSAAAKSVSTTIAAAPPAAATTASNSGNAAPQMQQQQQPQRTGMAAALMGGSMGMLFRMADSIRSVANALVDNSGQDSSSDEPNFSNARTVYEGTVAEAMMLQDLRAGRRRPRPAPGTPARGARGGSGGRRGSAGRRGSSSKKKSARKRHQRVWRARGRGGDAAAASPGPSAASQGATAERGSGGRGRKGRRGK